jgi:hypothetical protein
MPKSPHLVFASRKRQQIRHLPLTLCRRMSIMRPPENGSACNIAIDNRGIAQSGSAPALGAGCREFESLYPDQLFMLWNRWSPLLSTSSMVAVAHQVEPRIVTPEVAGSRPVGHPISLNSCQSAPLEVSPQGTLSRPYQ